MLKVAVPVEPRVAVPKEALPLKKMTVPVGVLVPDWEVTVAVRVTLCPVLADVGDACSVVVLAGRAVPVENTVME